MTHRRSTNKARSNARVLRKIMTHAEIKLWGMLRSKQLEGIRFRRQHPIGNYIVDFCAPHLKLVIELDGDHHGKQIEADGLRTRYLKSQGYQVLRFWNYDVENNLDGVLMRILEASDINEDPLQPPPFS